MFKSLFRSVSSVLLFLVVPAILSGQSCDNPTEPVPTGFETVFAELGGVQLISRELTKPCVGFDAAIIEARATDPTASLVTLTNLQFNGAHQVWSSLLPSPSGTAFEPRAGALYGSSWGILDSHFSFTPDMIAGGVYSFLETNDQSTTAELSLPALPTTAEPISGYGSFGVGQSGDAFFFDPEFQKSSIDLAYIVSPAEIEKPISMTVGVLGSGIVDAGSSGGAAFGYDGNPVVAFPPFDGEPGIVEPEPPLDRRIGSIDSRTNFNVSLNVFVDELRDFPLPISVARAPDRDAFYSVRLEDVMFEGDSGFLVQDFPEFEIAAGTSEVLPLPFVSSETGQFTGSYQFKFNDGTVIDANLSYNVLERTSVPTFPPIQPPIDPPTMPPVDPPFGVDCANGSPPPLPEGSLVFAEIGCVRLIVEQQPDPAPGLKAAKVVAQSLDQNASLVTFTNIGFTNTHQVWAGRGLQADGGTALGRPTAGPLYHEEWIPLDSHLLISKESIGGGVYDVVETNDGETSFGETLPTILEGTEARTGWGSLGTASTTDAFFVDAENQSNTIEVAYLVVDPSIGYPEMTLGVLGSGIRDAGTLGGAAFGYDGNPLVTVPVGAVPIPEPAFNGWWVVVAMALLRPRARRSRFHGLTRCRAER